jgi:hypothetical protein
MIGLLLPSEGNHGGDGRIVTLARLVVRSRLLGIPHGQSEAEGGFTLSVDINLLLVVILVAMVLNHHRCEN